ncbi:hypothetical protein H7J06_10030 [Mycobacterium hodleri]|uniref:hypothetical protein n=1 Tax=Mycolicibacterium hodleri TaxID=49897 RepID=UPI0027E23E6F|nr:hypothetical protein [Mycolicibacterium hodleri]MCV7133321.1 hypothetical protein [Mycolicibacterium hodleri]
MNDDPTRAVDREDGDRDRALRVIGWFIGTTTTRRYEVLDRQFVDGGSVQQHVLRADGVNGAASTSTRPTWRHC